MKVNNTILLVEDEENDVFFLQRAFREVGILNLLQVVSDGSEAMDYLGGKDKYAERAQFPLPALVLLDLKLPRVMGLEVLRWIREQPELKNLIVIILTSSQIESDIKMAYHLGANAYLVKPSSSLEQHKIATGIKQFWLELNHPAVVGQASTESAAHGH